MESFNLFNNRIPENTQSQCAKFFQAGTAAWPGTSPSYLVAKLGFEEGLRAQDLAGEELAFPHSFIETIRF